METFLAYDSKRDRILGYTRATSQRAATANLKRGIKGRTFGGRFGLQTMPLSDWTESELDRAGGFAIPRPADVQADMNAAFGWETETETETCSDCDDNLLIVRRDDETTARGTLPGGDFSARLHHRSGRFNEDGEELVVVIAEARTRLAMGAEGFATVPGPAICAYSDDGSLRLLAGPYFGTLRPGPRWHGAQIGGEGVGEPGLVETCVDTVSARGYVRKNSRRAPSRWRAYTEKNDCPSLRFVYDTPPETETETPFRPYFQDLDRDADLSGFLVVEPKADGCFGLLSSDGTVTSRNDTTLGRIDLKTDEDFVLVGEYLIRTPWSVETGRTGTFLAFDILVDEGEDVSGLPLLERKRRMARVVDSLGPAVESLPWYMFGYDPPLDVDDAWSEYVVDGGWEGLVLKSAGAYGEGWGRMKRVHERDFVLVDFEEPKVEAHVGRLVGSAVIGHYVDGELVTIGKVSAGFDHEIRREMFLDPDAFIGRVMKVRGHGVFKSGAMRHPVFNGWHADKAAEDCVPC